MGRWGTDLRGTSTEKALRHYPCLTGEHVASKDVSGVDEAFLLAICMTA